MKARWGWDSFGYDNTDCIDYDNRYQYFVGILGSL